MVRRKKLSLINWIFIVVCSVLLAASLLLSLSQKFSWNLPSWEDLFQSQKVMQLEGDFTVHAIDVGQGDSILIQCGDKSMLIDAGESDQGNKVLRYLKQNKVQKLDYVVATHPHSDHIGGMPTVLQNLEVDTMIMPELPQELVPTTKTYLNLLGVIKQKNLQVTKAKPGNHFSLGQANVEILGPQGQFEDLNNMSVVLRIDYGETSFLFTGDAEKEAEQAILKEGRNVKADVLKAGHHGSKTSTSKKFLAKVSPSYAVACVGNDNGYNHPSEETVKNLEKSGAKLYRTDLDGTIIFASNGKTISIQTEKS